MHPSSGIDELSSGLIEYAKKQIVGDPTLEKTDIGPLIQEKEVDRVEEWVNEAISGGAKVLTGGARIGKTCYQPTILFNPSYDLNVSKKEIFGPVVNIYPYQDRLNAIEHANNIPYSFQAAVFSKNIDTALDTSRRLNAAAVMINDHTAFRVDWMPFAGRKASGLGVGGILPTMMAMTEEKMTVIRSQQI